LKETAYIGQLTGMRIGIVLCSLALCCLQANGAELKTRNVVLIMSDGLRWQEVFGGAERDLMTKETGGVKNTNALIQEFWRETPDTRREALLPFFWNVIARQGQLFGNQDKGSVVTVSNGHNFSYPGYNEILTGIADPQIDSNDKKPNPNTNVFEWLSTKRGFGAKVGIFATWDVFPHIFNISRCQLPIWPAWEDQFKPYEIPVPKRFTEAVRDTGFVFDGVLQDGFIAGPALDHFEKHKPRLLFVGFGDTDEWAHAGRYDLYLQAARRVDDFVRRLWEMAQSKAQYRNKTTFIITADHGRGTGKEDWKNHGQKSKGSEADWLAVIGPDTPPLGERKQTAYYTLAQVPSTIAALLGHDFRSVSPGSGAPIQELLGGGN
jgi:hypothetical protein